MRSWAYFWRPKLAAGSRRDQTGAFLLCDAYHIMDKFNDQFRGRQERVRRTFAQNRPSAPIGKHPRAFEKPFAGKTFCEKPEGVWF